MAAAHLLAASTSSSSTAAFRPPLRLRSPAHTPHLRLNRTGTRLSLSLHASTRVDCRAKFDPSPDACRLHSQGGARSRWSARPRPTLKTVSTFQGRVAHPFQGVFPCPLLMRGCFGGFHCAAKPKAPEKAPAAGGSSFNQLLGIKGAKQETVRPHRLLPPSCYSPCIGFGCMLHWVPLLGLSG